jgi:DNA ligase (NAD+)
MKPEYKTVYEEMHDLNRQITHHADLYFNKDTQEVPNHVYDELVERFEVLAENHPEIAELFETAQKPVPIHEPTNQGLTAVKFDHPMLSLKKALTLEAVDKWQESKKLTDEQLFKDAKIDGLALELVYTRGRLVAMATRGDGLIGEDVMHALPLFAYIPRTLKGDNGELFDVDIAIRGEAFVLLDDFHRYNETSVKQKATPRNAVSGWIRALPDNQDPAIMGKLQFAAYWMSDVWFDTYEEQRTWCINQGFMAPPQIRHPDDMKNNARHPNVPMDGVVVRANSFALQKELGVNNRYPNWGIAYKFPDVEEVSTLEDVVWSTAATGRVIPVALYRPVIIGGVTCTRANLDNYKQFIALELRKGSVVGITRNGDVIPRLNRVIEGGKGPVLKHPEDCPSCGCVLEVRVGKQSADLICTNLTDCPAQLIGRCINLVHKRTLDIDGLGPVTLAALVENKFIQYPMDVLLLPFTAVPEKVYERIQAIKNNPVPVHVVIKALGLPNVDLVRAKKLAAHIPKWEQVQQNHEGQRLLDWLAKPQELQKVPGISAGIAIPISLSFESQDFVTNAVGLINLLKIDYTVPASNELKVCITGTLGQSREELIDYFADHGIELVDKLTKDCNYLLIGEKAGQSKVLKATELSIPTINATDASSIDALITILKTGAVQ